jgi:mycothiol synthase
VKPDIVFSPLPETVAREVTELARTAAESDGVAPLNEHTLLHLYGRHEGERHALVRDGGRLVGYAHLGADGSAEVVVAPDARRRGIGTALVRSLPAGRVWAHGRIDGVDAFAGRLGFEPVRELFRMERDAASAAALPDKPLPQGIGVRTFRPGEDDEAWLALNAVAFADHPEQSAWGPVDLAERLAQPWFDPDGFFLAQDGDRLAGFHWTKVHPGGVGEIYVLGIDPEYQGTGLGKALAVIGVRHLHDSGLRVVELYVDGTNTAARAMYEWLGFRIAAVDVQYAPVTANTSPAPAS